MAVFQPETWRKPSIAVSRFSASALYSDEGEKRMKPAVESAWWVLRVALGLGPLLAGADKFFNLLTDWSM
jgi:hypothetical protein